MVFNNVSSRSSLRARHASPFMVWRGLFAVFDDGTYEVRDYLVLEHKLSELAQRFPEGLGCLVVIPPGAKPIAEDVRKAIDHVLNSISVRGLVWAVLESGFRGATIRAILATLRLVGRRKRYPTHVTGDLRSALSWLVPQLSGSGADMADMQEALTLYERHIDDSGAR